MADLKGKGAFLTGGSTGIGRAVLDSLLSRGARVLFCDVNEEVGQKVRKELLLKYAESDVIFVACDVSDGKQLTEAFQKAVEEFGTIEVCVNNAGIMDERIWEKMIQINQAHLMIPDHTVQVAVIRGSYLALEHMRKDKGGRGGVIISTASINGLFLGQYSIPTYMSTKRAVVGFATSWANNPDQAKHGVKWGVVCPGIVDTPINNDVRERVVLLANADTTPHPKPDKSRWLRPADVAQAFMTLIDDDESNGYVIKVNRDRTEENAPVLQTVLTMDKSVSPVESLLVKKVISTAPVVVADE